MQITLDLLLKGKKTRIRNNEFLTPEAYVTPFLDRVADRIDDLVVRVIEPSQLTINPDGTEDAVYNKVMIEAPLYDGTDYAETVGMVYALDTRIPLVKFFKCLKSNEFDNLIIDEYSYIKTQKLESETPIDFRNLDILLNTEIHTNAFIQKMNTLDFDANTDNINYKLGQWIRFALNFNCYSDFGKIKIGTPDIITGYKDIFEDEKSDFYIQPGSHSQYIKIYNSLSKIIYESKDIVNAIDKTYLLKHILSL